MIAERMHGSLSSSAQLTMMGEFDVTEIVKLREAFLNQEKVIGVKDHLHRDPGLCNRKDPQGSSRYQCQSLDHEIKVWEDINIGVAVALGRRV